MKTPRTPKTTAKSARTWRFLIVWWTVSGVLIASSDHWAYGLVFFLLALFVHFAATDPAPSSAENR